MLYIHWRRIECFLDEQYTSSTFRFDDVEEESKNENLSLKLTSIGILLPLVAALSVRREHGLVGALSISGTYATPILYFMVPVLLAFIQRTRVLEDMNLCKSNPEKVKLIGEKIDCNDLDTTKQLVPEVRSKVYKCIYSMHLPLEYISLFPYVSKNIYSYI